MGEKSRERRERGEEHLYLAHSMQDDGCGASPLGTVGVGNLVLGITSFNGFAEFVFVSRHHGWYEGQGMWDIDIAGAAIILQDRASIAAIKMVYALGHYPPRCTRLRT